MINLVASPVPIPQPEPVTGRAAFPLTTAGGAPITFVTGDEQFQVQPGFLGNRSWSPSGILSMWVDASGLTTGKNLYVQTGLQKIQVAGGSQGWVLLITPAPLQFTITADSGAAGAVSVILLNYNVYASGTFTSAAGGGGGSTGSSGGSLTSSSGVASPVVKGSGPTYPIPQ